MATTVRCRASAVKSGPRSAPSPQKEPHVISPLMWNSFLPETISCVAITVFPEVADTKSTTGGAPAYVHVPSATSPTMLIKATTAKWAHQYFFVSRTVAKFFTPGLLLKLLTAVIAVLLSLPKCLPARWIPQSQTAMGPTG